MKKWEKLRLTDGTRIYDIRTKTSEKEAFIRLLRRSKLNLEVIPDNITLEELHISRTQMRIIALVRQRPGITQTALAERLGMSRQRVNYNIERLKRCGMVRVEARGRKTHCYDLG